MDSLDLMARIHDFMDEIAREDGTASLAREDGFVNWPSLDMVEVDRVGRSLAALFGITLD